MESRIFRKFKTHKKIENKKKWNLENLENSESRKFRNLKKKLTPENLETKKTGI